MGHLKTWIAKIDADNSHSAGTIPVLVELVLRVPDPQCIEQLQDAGLEIDDVIGNKVVGRIDGKSEEVLRSLPVVASIERSVKLEPR